MTKEWQPEEQLFLHHVHERESRGSGRRYFSRGGVKYALLALLEQESMHGYQMMKALEDQSGGTYKPSAGSIYPTLQMLRDQGFVESSKQDGKKVFEITDEGRAYLLEEKDNEGNEPERREDGEQEAESEEDGAQFERRKPNRRLTPAGKELLHLLKAAERAAVADSRKAEELRLVLGELRLSLRQILEDTAGGSEAGERI